MLRVQQPPLLRTKLHRPQYETDVVLRPQLLARLDEGLRYPLVLVSAPAGFGKTTLLSAWLERCSIPNTWLSLDAGDNDLSVFLNYFIAAVRMLQPNACAETEALARLATPAPETVLAHQLVNDLDVLQTNFVLVLDDYDQIENPVIHDLMSILVRRPPRPLRLVVAARRDPPLPVTKLRAGGLIAEVRMGDLRLEPQEVADFWRGRPDHLLDDASVAMLDSVVEGWPAGLRLAVISARLSPDARQTIAALANSNTHATDYLFREIFSHLPADRQHCLLRIAVLDRFCGPLCDTLCAAPDDPRLHAGRDFIDWLKSMNLFLVPLDDTGTWYRFHNLFLQLLRQQQRKLLDPQTVAALYGRAADWFAEAGMADDALAYALHIPSEERALRIVERQRVAVLNQEDWPRMRRWLELFSPQFYAQAPALWMIKASVLMNQFRLGELDLMLDRLAGHGDYAPEVAALRCQTYFWQGDAEQSLHLARQALETLPPDNIHAYGNALIFLALALQMRGAKEEGFERLMYELSNAAKSNAVLTTRALLALTGANWAAGNLDYVNRFAQRLLDVGEQNYLPSSRTWGHYFLGCTHYWRNELEQAERQFGAVVEQPLGAHGMVIMHSHFGLGLTYKAQGRSAEAQDVVEAVHVWAAESGDLSFVRQAEAFAARVSLLQGKQAAAFVWTSRYVETPPRLPMYFLESPLLILARISLAQGSASQLERAAKVLAALRSFLVSTHNSLRMLDVLVLEALLHKARRQPELALDTLRQALALAEPAKIVRPFVDIGPDMATLLHEAAKQGSSAAYAAQLLAAFSHHGAQGAARGTIAQAPAAQAVDPLTDREIEVLSLLAQRMSNKEIAEILVVAPVTVKTHTRNLFAKLQVSGRREAVERGRALGLLRTQ